MTATLFFTIVRQFEHAYEHALSDVAQRYRMSKAELDVLLFLANNPSFDAARDIVEYRRIAKSHVSKVVERLTMREMLVSEPDAKDRRVLRLRILPAAHDMLEEAKVAQRRVFDAVRSGISPEELTVINAVMDRVIVNLQEFFTN